MLRSVLNMLENASSTVAQVEAIGAIEFGGNGKTFAENTLLTSTGSSE